MTAISSTAPGFAKLYQVDLSPKDADQEEFVWQLEQTHPFDELILSWNGMRPEEGFWTFWASLDVGGWSPWIKYAEWGKNVQKTFKYAPQGSRLESYQDAVYPKDGLSTAFRVKATAHHGANLKRIDSLYACLSNLSEHSVLMPNEPLPSVLLPRFPRRSQLILDHPRSRDLCSPTAVSSAINYLSGSNKADPIAFAELIHDGEFDIYGNWILNTAQAYHELEGRFRCRVERLASFAVLHTYLMRGLPVIASVRGPLVGSYRPLTFGHLLCVIGFDAETQSVRCVDSAFPDDEQTFVSYPLKDFLDAWARRQNLAYLFTPKTLESSLGKMIRPTSE